MAKQDPHPQPKWIGDDERLQEFKGKLQALLDEYGLVIAIDLNFKPKGDGV
jgi:hypothetical protein